MQKVLIIHSKDKKIKELSAAIAEGLKENGVKVELKNTELTGKPVTFYPYDLVIVGAPTKGIFVGKIPSDLSHFLSQSKRTIGKNTMAFVTPRFFATNKALKKVMGELEKLGCIVKDFRVLKTKNDAISFGKNIKL